MAPRTLGQCHVPICAYILRVFEPLTLNPMCICIHYAANETCSPHVMMARSNLFANQCATPTLTYTARVDEAELACANRRAEPAGLRLAKIKCQKRRACRLSWVHIPARASLGAPCPGGDSAVLVGFQAASLPSNGPVYVPRCDPGGEVCVGVEPTRCGARAELQQRPSVRLQLRRCVLCLVTCRRRG